MKRRSDKTRASKFLIATAGAFALIGCTNSPAHRIEVCEQNGGTPEACRMAEIEHEKANPLPKFDNDGVDPTAALQAAYTKSANKRYTR